jgi:excisionase family DNA binding protein
VSTHHRRYFTTFEASRFLGVSLPTVVNWIKANRLKAHRTPGGHRRIARDELAGFIRRHGMPMPPELHGEGGAAARILVADADRAQREAALSSLRRAGYACAGAGDAFGAGLAVGLFRPDLVLVDLALPGVDVAAARAALAAAELPFALPVVAMGARRDDRGAQRRAQALGFDDLLARPIDLDLLRRKVEQALRQRRAA